MTTDDDAAERVRFAHEVAAAVTDTLRAQGVDARWDGSGLLTVKHAHMTMTVTFEWKDSND